MIIVTTIYGAASATPTNVYYVDPMLVRIETGVNPPASLMTTIEDEPEVQLRKRNRINKKDNYVHSHDSEINSDMRMNRNVREWHNRSKYRSQKMTA